MLPEGNSLGLHEGKKECAAFHRRQGRGRAQEMGLEVGIQKNLPL